MAIVHGAQSVSRGRRDSIEENRVFRQKTFDEESSFDMIDYRPVLRSSALVAVFTVARAAYIGVCGAGFAALVAHMQIQPKTECGVLTNRFKFYTEISSPREFLVSALSRRRFDLSPLQILRDPDREYRECLPRE